MIKTKLNWGYKSDSRRGKNGQNKREKMTKLGSKSAKIIKSDKMNIKNWLLNYKESDKVVKIEHQVGNKNENVIKRGITQPVIKPYMEENTTSNKILHSSSRTKPYVEGDILGENAFRDVLSPKNKVVSETLMHSKFNDPIRRKVVIGVDSPENVVEYVSRGENTENSMSLDETQLRSSALFNFKLEKKTNATDYQRHLYVAKKTYEPAAVSGLELKVISDINSMAIPPDPSDPPSLTKAENYEVISVDNQQLVGDLGCQSNSGLIPDGTSNSGDLSGLILTTSDSPKNIQNRGVIRSGRPKKTKGNNNPKIKAFLEKMKKRNVERLRNVNGMERHVEDLEFGMDSSNGLSIAHENDKKP